MEVISHEKWKSERQDNDGLQLNQDYEGLQAVPPQNEAVPWKYQQEEEAPRRKILGLSVAAFWVMVVIFVLLLAGAVGGGVAGGVAAQKKTTNVISSPNTSSSTTVSGQLRTTSTPTSFQTSSTSSTTSATSGPSPVINTPCTTSLSSNGTVLTATDSTGTNTFLTETAHTFTLLCNTNYPGGSAYGNPNVIDLYKIYTTDMASCIDTCVAYNLGYAVLNGDSPSCAAVAVVKAPGEFCYLKSATGINDTSTSGGASIDTAVLIG